MFLHINHSQDQIIAMRYLAKEILESKIISLHESMTDETEHDVKKKISKYELFIKKTKDIDNNDFMIFDYLKYAIGENQYFQSIFIDNKKYVWITRSKFISDLPTLNIKSANNVTGRLSKYIDMGILEKHTIKGKVSKVYFSFTDLASKILGKTLEDREFVRDILVKNGFINKNKSPQKIIKENPQPPKQPTEQKEKPKEDIAQILFDAWNEKAKTSWISSMRKLSQARRKKVTTRLKENGDFQKEFLEALSMIDNFKEFNRQSWFTFDFLTNNEDNLNKVLEGKYTEMNSNTSSSQNQQRSTKQLKPLAIEYLNGLIESYDTGESLNWIVEKNGIANLEKRYYVVGKPMLNEELKRRGVA